MAKAEAGAAVSHFLAATPDLTPFAEAFPFAVADASLALASSSPVLTAVRQLNQTDCAAIFCSKRYVEVREYYDAASMSDKQKAAFGNVDEVVTIRRDAYQAFDALIIRPKLERIEVAIDTHRPMPQPMLATCVASVLATAGSSVPAFLTLAASPPQNLFPAIKGIYTTEGEGVVLDLGFRTLTRSVKLERMQKGSDLRKEAFHRAGINAVDGNITPYELRVAFEFTVPSGYAEVHLNSNVRVLSDELPRLDGMTVENALTDIDIRRAVDKVVKYLSE